MNTTHVDHTAAWLGEIDAGALRHRHSFDSAMEKARESVQNDAYCDVHCWIFTPRGFAILLRELCRRGLVHFICESFHDTEPDSIEFFVTLRASTKIEEMTRSWRLMAEKVRIDVPGTPLAKEMSLNDMIEQERRRSSLLDAELLRERQTVSSLRAKLKDACALLAQTQNESDLIRRSRSWRLTLPLRYLSSVFKNVKAKRQRASD